MAATSPSESAAERRFLGHPAGLFVLFFTEMWERFSYYGMRALLILYLTKQLLFGDQKAYLIYGAYTALVYITPVIGGHLADRYLGYRKAVLYGGVLIALGHLLLTVEGDGAGDRSHLPVFYLALSFIIVGTGFLKANISVMVGQLYGSDDARRDPGFTLFYMGINLGAFLGAIACGWLGERYGWNIGFGAAAVGMLSGLAVFTLFRRSLAGCGDPHDPSMLGAHVLGLAREWWIYASGIAGVIATWALIQNQELVGLSLGMFGALVVLYILYTAVFRLERVERDRTFAALFLIAVQPLFWGLFEQAGSSLNLYTDRNVDRIVFGIEVPASVFQSLNALYIFLLAPVAAWLWSALARRKLEPPTPIKFGLALLQLGAGFLVLVAGILANSGVPTPVLYILLIYLLHTTGELCLSPVGLSAMTRLSTARMLGLMMGTWFLAIAGGNFIAGLIAGATSPSDGVQTPGAIPDIVASYQQIGWIAIAVGVAVMLLSPLVRRMMHADAAREGGDAVR